jgi:hypothetical protein
MAIGRENFEHSKISPIMSSILTAPEMDNQNPKRFEEAQ